MPEVKAVIYRNRGHLTKWRHLTFNTELSEALRDPEIRANMQQSNGQVRLEDVSVIEDM